MVSAHLKNQFSLIIESNLCNNEQTIILLIPCIQIFSCLLPELGNSVLCEAVIET